MRKLQCFLGSPLKLLSLAKKCNVRLFWHGEPVSARLPSRRLDPRPRVHGDAPAKMPDIPRDHLGVDASGNGPDERIPKWNRLMPRFRQEPSPLDGGRPVEDANCSVIVLQYKPEFHSPLAALPFWAFASLRLCFNSPGCRPGLYRNPKPCFHEPTCNLE